MSSLRDRLEGVEVPDGADARERAWAAVASEHAGRERRRSRIGTPRRARASVVVVGMVVALFAAAVAASATQPGAAVRTFVVRVLGADRPAPRARIGPLPPGRMLVTSPRGAWIVARDGTRRLLGPYAGATWSPRGLYVAAWSGVDLHAVAPDGRVAWTLRTPGRVASAAWSPDGFRVAYRRAGGLGIVAGDGTAPRVLAASVAAAGPAWRPTAPHTLAWVDARGRVIVRDVDSAALVWRSAPFVGGGARELSWSSDGRLLLVRWAGALRLIDVPSGRVRDVRLAAGERAIATAWAPRGRRLAVVVRRPARSLSQVLVTPASTTLAQPPVFATTGTLGAPAWSPDGRRVLVRWAEADQWLLLPASPRGAAGPARVVAIARAAARFGGAPVVRGWCCGSG